jgi:peptide deformylase
LSILPIYTYNQPVLRKKAKPVRSVDDGLRRFVGDMFDTMHNANGIGLAANQVGDLRRVIVIDLSDPGGEEPGEQETPRIQPEARVPLVLINPEILEERGESTMEEGCLSLPDIRDEVERAETVRLRYVDLDLREQEVTATGLFARVIQHEIDHLNGILFIDRLGKVKQKLLRGRLNKLRKGEAETLYPVVTEAVEAT